FLRGEHDLVVSHMLTVWQDVIAMHNDPQTVEVERMSSVPFSVVRPRLRSRNRLVRTFVEKKRFAPERYRKVIAFSRRSADGIAAACGVSADRLAVIRHGVDASYFFPGERLARRAAARDKLGLSGDDLVFVYVGDSWKGLEFAIRGLAAGSGSGRRVLVASGPFRPGPFMGLAEASGLRLICDNDWRDIRDLYGAGDALINPTPMDTFGLAVLEAMAMGLPAITTRYAGVSELLRDGEDAFILKEPWDTEAIAGMADRIADDAFRERMSSAASALASGLSWERPAVDHLSIYESAMRSKVSGGA
ncbi:MAG TPA: glycosyltransferase family 4 protein, partial [Elusimicrobiales bacterium]|nr:glycosyltransferase family 4 protein [Elusimicrobiales bacterium]